jgi:3-methyladenine DNA glycosylase AlkD
MNCKSLLNELESLGSEQTRKTYGRHGVKGRMFGVSYKDFGLLKKRIKTDHALAEQLWATAIHDARILATMIADPARMDSATVDRWAEGLQDHIETDALARLVSQSPVGRKKGEKWRRSKQELLSSAGWSIAGHLAWNVPEIDDAYFAELVPQIEQGLEPAPNRTRYSMNNALIAIGVRSEPLRKLAVAAARRIGPVEVDHGDTCCETPDAEAYIAKTLAHRKQQAQKKQAPKKKAAKRKVTAK